MEDFPGKDTIVAMPSFRESSLPRDWTHISCIAGGFFTAELPGKPPFLLHFDWINHRQTSYLYYSMQGVIIKGILLWFSQRVKPFLNPICRVWSSRDTPFNSNFSLSSVQSLSRVRLFAIPWIAARQASLSITNSRSSLRWFFLRQNSSSTANLWNQTLRASKITMVGET